MEENQTAVEDADMFSPVPKLPDDPPRLDMVLSVEIWTMVFKYLSLHDLCSVCLVSKYLNTIAVEMASWADIDQGIIGEIIQRERMDYFLNMQRFTRINGVIVG